MQFCNLAGSARGEQCRQERAEACDRASGNVDGMVVTPVDP